MVFSLVVAERKTPYGNAVVLPERQHSNTVAAFYSSRPDYSEQLRSEWRYLQLLLDSCLFCTFFPYSQKRRYLFRQEY